MNSEIPSKPPVDAASSDPVDGSSAAHAAAVAESQALIRAEKGSVAVSAMIVAFGILMSRILGLIRDVMTAKYFPTDARDAFLAAFRLPNLFRRILGEGSLSVSFIPIFIEILSGKKTSSKTETEARARELVSIVFSILMTISFTITVLATIFMEEIVGTVVQGFSPAKIELTVELGRIMFGFLILVSLYAYFMAILNSLKKFAVAALAPCFLNLAMIGAALISGRLANEATVLAWSVIVGGVLQMAILIPGVVKSGFLPRFTFKWNNPDVIQMFKTILPSMFGMSIMQITQIVNMSFASFLPAGTLSYLYFADRILELPLSLVVVSVGSALLPTLAKYSAEGNRDAMGDTINHYIRLIIFVALPAALGMFVLAQPITEVLFLRGEFKYADAVQTAQVIRVYSFSVIVASGVRILAQGFYAIKNTWYPALAGAVALISHVIFAFVLTRTFKIEGLAAASVASGTVNLLMLATAYNSWVGSLHLKTLFKSFGKFMVCGAAMIGSLQAYPFVKQALTGRVPGARTITLLAMILLGALVYMACAHLLRIPEFRETAATFGTKFQRKLSRFRKKS